MESIRRLNAALKRLRSEPVALYHIIPWAMHCLLRWALGGAESSLGWEVGNHGMSQEIHSESSIAADIARKLFPSGILARQEVSKQGYCLHLGAFEPSNEAVQTS